MCGGVVKGKETGRHRLHMETRVEVHLTLKSSNHSFSLSLSVYESVCVCECVCEHVSESVCVCTRRCPCHTAHVEVALSSIIWVPGFELKLSGTITC